jgi:osmotically-inducible protein OsmY
MTSVGCARVQPVPSEVRARVPINGDEVVHAFDSRMEMRVIDRLELDSFLRERNIRVDVTDGLVSLNGEVWTPLEKERAAELLRGVPGVIDVDNKLAVRPPTW